MIALACSKAAFRAPALDDTTAGRSHGAIGVCGAHEPRDGENPTSKNELKPWLKKSWCFPKEADADFVYHMEDVLDVYCQPHNPVIPQICMDEMGKNLVKDKYPPEPAKPRQVAREDYTFEKEGRANLFIAYEPLAGKRVLKVTEQRTKKDWALFMRGGCWKTSIPTPPKSWS